MLYRELSFLNQIIHIKPFDKPQNENIKLSPGLSVYFPNSKMFHIAHILSAIMVQ